MFRPFFFCVFGNVSTHRICGDLADCRNWEHINGDFTGFAVVGNISTVN